MAGLLGELPGAPRIETVVVRTTGDRLADQPIERIGGQGAFVKEVQSAVLEGRAELAVHSAKDLPSVTPAGLVLACVPERADPRDALVGRRLDELPCGAPVACGSVRRRAQLAWLRPDLSFVELRGNMATRLARAETVGAGVVALAALQRLGLDGHVAEILDPGLVLPQVAQGALAVECRQDDVEMRTMLGRSTTPSPTAACWLIAPFSLPWAVAARCRSGRWPCRQPAPATWSWTGCSPAATGACCYGLEPRATTHFRWALGSLPPCSTAPAAGASTTGSISSHPAGCRGPSPGHHGDRVPGGCRPR